MGYTHYFTAVRDITEEEWDKIVYATWKLYDNLPDGVEVFGVDGNHDPHKEVPIVDTETIHFNGNPAKDEDHEDFLLYKKGFSQAQQIHPGDGHPLFNFCKTAEKPYDLLVCSVLTVVNYYAPGAYEIKSDGDVVDWLPALEFVRQTIPSEGVFLVPFR